MAVALSATSQAVGKGRTMGVHAISAGPLDYGGLEQFGLIGGADGMSFCVSGHAPYALDLDTSVDVICLLLGRINSRSRFEDGREEDVTFLGESAAFHPRDGRIRVKATDAHGGFIAFGFSEGYEEISDHGVRVTRALKQTCNNIQNQRIRHLAHYARSSLSDRRTPDIFELQCLGSLVYMETTRLLNHNRVSRSQSFSKADLRRIEEFIHEQMESPISCAQLARIVDLPLRVVFDGMKAETGMTLYRFVLEKRTERACDLLRHSNMPISEIALRCGFSSQQHLTTTLSRICGLSPMQVRKQLP